MRKLTKYLYDFFFSKHPSDFNIKQFYCLFLKYGIWGEMGFCWLKKVSFLFGYNLSEQKWFTFGLQSILEFLSHIIFVDILNFLNPSSLSSWKPKLLPIQDSQLFSLKQIIRVIRYFLDGEKMVCFSALCFPSTV